MKYSKSTNGFYLPAVHRNKIPSDAIDISDADYAALMAGQTQGKCIKPDAQGRPTLQDPAPEVPSVVTMRQARLALLAAGKLSDADAAIASAGDAANIEWQYAHQVERSSALVADMAQALALTDAELDELFTSAAAL